jgi:hypothetical protein
MADNINTNPVTPAEVDEWIAGLSEDEQSELRRQRLVNAALARETPKAPNLGVMTDSEFAAYRRSIGLP